MQQRKSRPACASRELRLDVNRVQNCHDADLTHACPESCGMAVAKKNSCASALKGTFSAVPAKKNPIEAKKNPM